ncbi:Rossmann-like and DUF2520 domain-containing protein [Hymenobacter crusticola]|uniref:DUF2520 domain-containing protein n=1 Tax=Hymenobacter crusticola TaxID=1770526 RepID=A0A2C9ZTU3_9BACT|nr:Rossmann-like and DUF2520 domain-containing protein [Hymenobacter crusticola]OUJ69346.1 hypothetical protein BXP70_26645 [Hymenobacter crusticola]
MLTIVLIGTGRVATQLGPALVHAGHRIAYVWSRTLASAERLAATLPDAQAGTSLDMQAHPADLYVVAVPDAVIPVVLAEARFPSGALVAHTSGTLPLQIFASDKGLRSGGFYPLQTFSLGRQVDWQKVPLCIEATDASSEARLLAVAHSISQQVALVATPQRQALHVAAVFACNFTNHLLGISHALLTEAGLSFSLLAPLVQETVDKAFVHPPFSVQTGPAARGDEPTIASHQVALTTHPRWLELYKELTANIKAQTLKEAANNEEPLQL